MSNKKKLPLLLVAISLILILIGSIFAQMFNTSSYTVSVERISFDTEKGTLSGLLYMPKGASAEDPRPTVVVTHGYLNSSEMQDANAIELSRRGYVVLALDMYDHGHSKANAENTGGFFDFWPTSLYDAVTYMYQQPYVLKDEEGNGIIGVTGHSMGGFSTAMALYLDETAYETSGIRMIYCGLSEGADYMYTSALGLTPEVAAATGGGRTIGKVCAEYDEFFFLPDDYANQGTVIRKDWVSTTAGKTFLEQESPEAGVWYKTSDGGQRIVYQPKQTHPWNHFSKTTTGYAIDFYETAFAGYNENLNLLPADNQIWQLKEFFELVALVGFVLLFVPLIMLLTRLPFLSLAKTDALQPQPSVTALPAKIGTFALMLCCILLPAVFFPALMDGNTSAEPMMILTDAGAVFGVAGIAAILWAGKAGKDSFRYRTGGIVAAIAGFGLMLLASHNFLASTTPFWSAPSINQIAYWTLACTLISALIMSMVYLVSKAPKGVGLSAYGLKVKPVTVLASFCVAAIAFVVGYAILFAVDAVFTTDFRIWVFAFKTFEPSVIPAMVHYLPIFFVYYLVSSVAICINTNTEKLQGIKGYLVAILLNAGGITIFIARQYITLFATGTAAHPTQALSAILLFGMIPTLAIAACFSRALYKRTGNVWTPAFLNALLMTTMTLANTAVYYQS